MVVKNIIDKNIWNFPNSNLAGLFLISETTIGLHLQNGRKLRRLFPPLRSFEGKKIVHNDWSKEPSKYEKSNLGFLEIKGANLLATCSLLRWYWSPSSTLPSLFCLLSVRPTDSSYRGPFKILNWIQTYSRCSWYLLKKGLNIDCELSITPSSDSILLQSS